MYGKHAKGDSFLNIKILFNVEIGHDSSVI